MNTRHLIITGLAAGLILGGCASTGEDPYEDEAVIEALGLEELNLDRPGLFDEWFARRAEPRDEAREQRLRQLEAALERMDRERDADREPVLAGEPRHRLGILLGPDADERIDSRLAAAAPDYPLRLVRTESMRDALDDLGCERPMDCATELRTYPGLRLVLEIRGEDDPRFITAQLHDLELEASSAPRRLALPDDADGQVPRATLDALADHLLLAATDQANSLPWLARSLGQDNGNWLINAGRSAGLQEEQELQVQRAGRPVLGSGGTVRGWIPGEAIGRVRVVQVTGSDSALVEQVEGEAPEAVNTVLVPLR